jgi:hypothetical protein
MSRNISDGGDVATRAVTLTETREWQDLLAQENQLSPETLLNQLLQRRVLTTVEMMWVVKAMLRAYGQKHSVFHRVPGERLSRTVSSLLRIMFLLLDNQNEPDDNLRAYITAKLREACWGLTDPTAAYLKKFNARFEGDQPPGE